ncbi:MAG TPA: helix-turn-helix domain-containing protein [Gemmatimonadales bacterium]|nr:helix-turn-helix domain-containing protein [Gemmatimonadales bacterium]
MASDPNSDQVLALLEALRSAGLVVTTTVGESVPLDASPEPDFVISEAASQPAPESLAAAEARHIRSVLHHTRGNRRQAALLLGVARSTLLDKIRRYGL